MKVRDLSFNGDNAVLLRYPNGEQALWIADEYLAERSDVQGVYTINDVNERIPVGADEDVDVLIEDWKLAVEWDD